MKLKTYDAIIKNGELHLPLGNSEVTHVLVDYEDYKKLKAENVVPEEIADLMVEEYPGVGEGYEQSLWKATQRLYKSNEITQRDNQTQSLVIEQLEELLEYTIENSDMACGHLRVIKEKMEPINKLKTQVERFKK